MHVSSYSVFNQNLSLHGETISLDTVPFRYPYRIAVRDSFSVIMDLHNADYFFHAFTFPDWEYLGSFGKRGEAPEEMVQVANFRFQSRDSIWVLDPNRMKIFRWSIEPASKSLQLKEQVDLDKSLVRTLDLYPCNSGFIVPDYMGKHRFHEIDFSGKYLHSTGKIPTRRFYKDAAAPAVAQAWRSFIDYHSGHNLLVMATQLGEVLEIYNLGDGGEVIMAGPNGEPKFQVTHDAGIPIGIMGFNDIFISDNYIYTIFDGTSFDDIVASAKSGKEREKGGRFIYKFGLDGTPVCNYTLDMAITGLYVDEKGGYVLGTNANSNDPVVRFKLDNN